MLFNNEDDTIHVPYAAVSAIVFSLLSSLIFSRFAVALSLLLEPAVYDEKTLLPMPFEMSQWLVGASPYASIVNGFHSSEHRPLRLWWSHSESWHEASSSPPPWRDTLSCGRLGRVQCL
jgi:hypothetical protein